MNHVLWELQWHIYNITNYNGIFSNSKNYNGSVRINPNKKDTYPSTSKVEGAIEVHDPMLGSVGWDRSLHVGPFGDEIGEHLRLYRLAALEINGVRVELYRPFNDAAIGFLIT